MASHKDHYINGCAQGKRIAFKGTQFEKPYGLDLLKFHALPFSHQCERCQAKAMKDGYKIEAVDE